MEDMTFAQFISAYNGLYKETDGLYHRLARHFGLSDSAFWILYVLQAAGRPITQSELGNTLFLSKQTINSALKGLEQAGHIRLEDAPGRGKYLCLTPSGRALTERTVRPVLAMEERAFLALTGEERRALLALEGRFLALLHREARPILSHSEQEVSPQNGHQAV